MKEIKIKLIIETKNYKEIYLSLKPDVGSRNNLDEKIYLRKSEIVYEAKGKISHVKASINTLISLIEMLKEVDDNGINARRY